MKKETFTFFEPMSIPICCDKMKQDLMNRGGRSIELLCRSSISGKGEVEFTDYYCPFCHEKLDWANK